MRLAVNAWRSPRGLGSIARALAGGLALAVLVSGGGCASGAVPRAEPIPTPERSLEVRASAYNSVPEQTDSTPNLTASGAILRPGLRALAVSADLLEMGLSYGTVVQIEGVPGDWIVLDRVHSRWRRKIDLYMGTDVQAALEWGVRRVRIRWEAAEP